MYIQLSLTNHTCRCTFRLCQYPYFVECGYSRVCLTNSLTVVKWRRSCSYTLTSLYRYFCIVFCWYLWKGSVDENAIRRSFGHISIL